MQIEAYRVTEDRSLESTDARDMSDDWFLDETVRWIKITSATPEEVEQALRPLELHPNIVGACARPRPPQVESLEKVHFIAMPIWGQNGSADACVRIICVATTLITIQDRPESALDRLAGQLVQDRRLIDAGTAALTYEITEAIYKSLLPSYLALRRDVEEIADKLEHRPGDVENEDILSLKNHATGLSDLLDDYLFCLSELQVARSDTLRFDKVKANFQELVSDFQRGQKLVVRMEDRIRDLRQSKLNALQESTNHRLNILAILSAIYLPSTLIAGIYGMNFENIPITEISYGYFVVLALMISLVVGQLVFFYRRGWFD